MYEEAAGTGLGTRSFLGLEASPIGKLISPFLPSSLGTPRACRLLALSKLSRTVDANPMLELSAICFHALS